MSAIGGGIESQYRHLEEAVQTAAARQTSEKTSHDTATSTTASSLIILRIVALRRRLSVWALLRRIGTLAGGKGTLLLVVVAHLRRTLLIVALLLAALLVWILLVAAVCRLRGTWGRAVGGRFLLLESHGVMVCDRKGGRYGVSRAKYRDVWAKEIAIAKRKDEK
jgi:hypothetical protein